MLEFTSIIFISAVGGRSSVTTSSKRTTKVILQILRIRKQVKNTFTSPPESHHFTSFS